MRFQNGSKSAEIQDTKTLNLSRNIVRCKFWLIFRVFHLARSTWQATKNICCGLKKCGALIGWYTRARANLLRDKLWVWWKTSNKAKNLLLKVDARSTFRNNFLQPATNVFVARQVDHTRWKTGNIDENLQRNNVARQVERFCISYYAALTKRQLNVVKFWSEITLAISNRPRAARSFDLKPRVWFRPNCTSLSSITIIKVPIV